MIYVTGDTHGKLDIAKIQPEMWPEGQTLSRNDYLVICGDVGAVWGSPERDDALLSWYEAQPWTTLWVDGNHENHDRIDSFEVSERFGGRVQVVPGYPHFIHLMRGEVYDLPSAPGETVKVFVMGGAPSRDRAWRTEGVNWWEREMPDDEEYDNAENNLGRCNWSVDYVFTHEVPENAMMDALDEEYSIEHYESFKNKLAGFLQYVDDQLDKDQLEMWYAGHYHRDCLVMDDQHCILYDEVVTLGSGPLGF